LKTHVESKLGLLVHSVPVFFDREPPPVADAVGPWVASEFARIGDEIEAFAAERGGPAVLRDSMAIIDMCSRAGTPWVEMEILHDTGHPALSLAGLLILAFPEIHWILRTPNSWPSAFMRDIHAFAAGESLESVIAAHDRGLIALFDPAGLRQVLRRCLLPAADSRRVETKGSASGIRTEMAVIVDEEMAYAYFNALAAFRCGYRALPVTTWGAMQAWLASGATAPIPAVAFEDIYLNFCDYPRTIGRDTLSGGANVGLSHLSLRDRLFVHLGAAQRRVFVTVGHQRGKGRSDIWEQNKAYLASRSQKVRWVFKPVGGLHRLLIDGGLRARMKTKMPGARALSHSLDETPHSAPGRLLMVCDRLIQRSERLLNDRASVADAVHAAVLATEAGELLSDRTPTTALEAMALKHEAEVIAESRFIGVEYNLDLTYRFREITSEARAISKWFGARWKRSALNARLTIVERLANRFRAMNQVEEELTCLAEARRLRFAFWIREKPWRWVLSPFLSYIAFALSSLPVFLAVIAAWIVFFGGVYWLANFPGGGGDPWQCLVASGFFTFVLEPPLNLSAASTGSRWLLILGTQGAISFTNLGLLLSHLYMIVSRR
jgi:hypothetical protein